MHCQNPQFWRFLTSKTGKNFQTVLRPLWFCVSFAGSHPVRAGKELRGQKHVCPVNQRVHLFINGKGRWWTDVHQRRKRTLYTSGAHSRGLHSLHYWWPEIENPELWTELHHDPDYGSVMRIATFIALDCAHHIIAVLAWWWARASAYCRSSPSPE